MSTLLDKLEEVDLKALTPLQRILLVTDGTLTEILQAHFLEPIVLVKLSQDMSQSNTVHNELKPAANEQILERKVLLRGGETGTPYVYAESFVAHERLTPKFRDELLKSDIPLGRLWLKYKLETFKEMIHIRRHTAGKMSHFLGCDPTAHVLSRSYRVFARGKPLMIISEYFLA